MAAMNYPNGEEAVLVTNSPQLKLSLGEAAYVIGRLILVKTHAHLSANLNGTNTLCFDVAWARHHHQRCCERFQLVILTVRYIFSSSRHFKENSI